MKRLLNTNGQLIGADPEWVATIDSSATPGDGLAALARLLLEMVAEEERLRRGEIAAEVRNKDNCDEPLPKRGPLPAGMDCV
jgi:hypothetical protein